MRLRTLSMAFLLGALTTGGTWLLLQPALWQMVNAVVQNSPVTSVERDALGKIWQGLPFYLAFSWLLASAVCYLGLYFMVERPLAHVEEGLEQLGRLQWESPLEEPSGPLVSRVSSALNRTASSLSRAQAELLASEKLATVGRLAAGVAHEVGNPLSGIMGYVSLARSEAKQNPKLLDYLSRIDAELSRIDTIVKSLLDLGRPAKMKPGVVDVGRAVESCHRLLSKGNDFEAVELSLFIEPALLVNVDSSALSQVFINLLLNAAQAMDGRGRVTVRGTKEGSWVRVEVQDTGPGIPLEILPRIFDPFFTTKNAGRGTGLGLAVCQHLVTAMGGQLSAANAEGGGAVMSMKLPAGYVGGDLR